MSRFKLFYTRRLLVMGLFSTFLSILSNPKKVMASSELENDYSSLDNKAWRKRLTPQAYNVLRNEGTEAPFSSTLNDEKREGIFHCAGCDAPLFSSKNKFDSGTGWPSFWTYLDKAIDTKVDFKLIVPRTEYHCGTCGGHQGHVFDDGPNPTGKRYCNNGVALNFKPTSL